MDSVDRTDIDHPRGLIVGGPGRQLGEKELGGVEDALNIEVEDPVPRPGVVLVQWCTPGSAGVVDQYVDGWDGPGRPPPPGDGILLGGEIGGKPDARSKAGQLRHRRPDRGALREATTTSAPAATKPPAIMAPMPRVPPVTTTVFPDTENSASGVLGAELPLIIPTPRRRPMAVTVVQVRWRANGPGPGC